MFYKMGNKIYNMENGKLSVQLNRDDQEAVYEIVVKMADELNVLQNDKSVVTKTKRIAKILSLASDLVANYSVMTGDFSDNNIPYVNVSETDFTLEIDIGDSPPTEVFKKASTLDVKEEDRDGWKLN